MRVDVDINVNDIMRQLQGLSALAHKGITRSMNDAAFDLRKQWMKDIEDDVDNPTTFTKRVVVRKAKDAYGEALTFFPDIQAEYLQRMVEGGKRVPGDYATLNKTILIPVKAKLNKFGNFRRGPRQWLATVEERIKGGFVGSPGGGKEGKAVYQPTRSGLKLLAIFTKQSNYSKRLDLERSADQAVRSFDSIVQKNFNVLLGS